MKNVKYLFAFIIPILTFTGVLLGGLWTYATVIFSFVLIPILEPIFPNSDQNYSAEEKKSRLIDRFFDFLLYANIPLVYGILMFTIYALNNQQFETFERLGLIFSLGTLLGTCGINVAHELGHRRSLIDQALSRLLLFPSFYMHFFIEHNQGHHKYVSTPHDPATARKNESIYFFWVRSVIKGYISAWKIESKRLTRAKIPFFHWKNQMLRYLLWTLVYLGCLLLFFELETFAIIVSAGVFSFLLLETINYVEHYGLMRKILENGRFEPVNSSHSWNSNHELGRIILYELTRHSDHHYQPHKKYQILEHHDNSPQLPFGYPSSMLLTLLPPVWFKVMNKRIESV
jgi:alkane 1-monooxygenase